LLLLNPFPLLAMCRPILNGTWHSCGAAEHGVQVLVFPELSLTGYEPALATELAIASTRRCAVATA
jgi:hypothetical protein